MSRSAYHFYESENETGFKQRFLPMDFARRVAAVLADHGINPDDVLALAGIGLDESAGASLSAGEEQLLSYFRSMSPDQRRLYLQLGDQFAQPIIPADVVGSASATVHDGRPDFQAKHEKQVSA